MAQKSPTAKPRKKKTAEEGIRIYDVSGTKVVGQVIRRTMEGYELLWAAQLSFHPVPLEGGRRFRIDAQLTPFVPCLPGYMLMHTAIRGHAIEHRPWLSDMYRRFTARAETGEFDLNPYAPPEKMELQQGDGATEPEVQTVNTLESRKPTAETSNG